MKTSITMTSKGQFTLPASVRKELGLKATGDTLQLEFDNRHKTVRLSKPVAFAELQKFVQTRAKHPDAPLPENIHEWYEQERIAELKKRDTL
jgi:bifunctional DNA-binding transcriptional regulator/antitoxin component of YhaV-PrlF toxin-antitoxin module